MIFAKIFSPLTPYSASGRTFLIRGICLIAYRMLLTRYVFFKEKEMRNVLCMFFLLQRRNDLLLKFTAVQVGFLHNLQLTMT